MRIEEVFDLAISPSRIADYLLSEDAPPPGHVQNSMEVHKDFHTNPFLVHSPAMLDQHHGINFGTFKPLNSGGGVTPGVGFAINHKGVDVFIKPAYRSKHSSVHREVLYHNLAHAMGMGHHVPTTSSFIHPHDVNKPSRAQFGGHIRNIELLARGTSYSTMQAVTNETVKKEHPRNEIMDRHTASSVLADHEHARAQIHRLGVMNTILGNADRHGGNFFVEWKHKTKEPHIHLIDHGFTLDHDDSIEGHAYLGDHGNKALHPHAMDWIKNVDPNKVERVLKANQAPHSTHVGVMAGLHKAKDLASSFGRGSAPPANKFIRSIADHAHDQYNTVGQQTYTSYKWTQDLHPREGFFTQHAEG